MIFRGVAHVNDVMLKISTILNVKKKKLVQT